MVDSAEQLAGSLLKPLLSLEPHSKTVTLADIVNKSSPELATFQAAIRTHSDLVVAAGWPGMDHDIIMSLVIRVLWKDMFSTELYGQVPSRVSELENITEHMRTSATPKRGLSVPLHHHLHRGLSNLDVA